MKKKAKFIFFLIGLTGVAFLIMNTDLSSIDWSFFLSKKFFILFAVLIGIWMCIYTLHTLVYRIILKEDSKKIGFTELLGICISGFAINNVTPAGIAGGEPYRIMELKRYCKTEKATSTSLTFTILYATGHFIIWFIEAILYLILKCPGEVYQTVIICIAGTVFAFVAALVIFGNKHNLADTVVRIFSHLPIAGKYIRKFYESKKESLREIDTDIAEFRKTPKRLFLSILTELSARFLEGIEYYLIFRSLGLSVSILQGFLIMSNASLMGNVLFFIPMQVGTRESGTQFALSWFFKDTSAVIPGCLIYRIRDITCTILGVFCILVNKRKNQE